MAESEMDSFQSKVLRRARELNRLQAGKASETISAAPDETVGEQIVDLPRNSAPQVNLNIDPGNSSRDDTPLEFSAGKRKRGEEAVGGNPQGLWDRFSKMEDIINKRDEQQAEILSNIVFSVAKLQQQLDGDNPQISQDRADVCSVSDMSTEGNAVGIDGLFETESKTPDADDFLFDLERSYQEQEAYGQSVNQKLSKLVESAVSNPLSEETFRQLEETYKVPENCKSLAVPKVNRELWQAFKPARQSDLALQNSQKHMSMAMVSVIKLLHLLMEDDWDKDKIKAHSKDAFKILSHGIHSNTRKRRDLIKPLVPSKYRKACQIDAKPSSYLFGEDLDQKVDTIEKEDRRSQKLSGRSFLGHGFQSGNRSRQGQTGNQKQRPKSSAMQGNQHMQKNRGKPYPKGNWTK